MNKLDKQSLNCNKVNVKVPKILSYQTLVYKNGVKSFKKQAYKDYQLIISLQLRKLPTIEHKEPLTVFIRFNCTKKSVGDLDNITKPILDILEINDKIYNDRYITSLHLEKTFGHKENSIDIEITERQK